jgi:hypothetical protein
MSQSNELDEVMGQPLFLLPTEVLARGMGEILTTSEQLIMEERNSMHDLAELEALVNGHVSAPQPTIRDWYRFSGKIFRLWDTSRAIPDDPKPFFDSLLPAEHSVRVGTSKSRSGGLDYAYLSISVQIDPHQLSLSWNNHMGETIWYKDINFDYSIEECVSLAMSQYDQCVVDRVKRYNERLIIANARRRLADFSRNGFRPGQNAVFLHGQVILKPLVFACTSPDQKVNLIRNTVEQLRVPQELGGD